MKALILFASLATVLLYSSCLGENGLSISPTDPCDLDNVENKNGRMIGLDILDLTESNTFEDNLDLADDLEIEFISLHLSWSSIETSGGTYADPGDALFLLNQVADEEELELSLTIRPIDLTGKTVPEDLENLRFNDDIMVARFKSLIDFVFTRIDENLLLNLQIGNEIDGYDTSGEEPSFWEDYGEFLAEINNYIKGTYGNITIGFTGTLYGLVDNPTVFNSLLDHVDVLGVTYYPIESDFDVQNPKTVKDDLDDLLELYTDNPIYLQEIGYQSSGENRSSESKQADFYCNFFSYWDDHIEEIATANIVRLNDYSTQVAIDAAEPYGIDDDGFIEYLRTLGIRNYEGEGSDKQAFDVIKDHLDERGW